eukprot:1800233-Pleurochrysis_carterae.AAC.1
MVNVPADVNCQREVQMTYGLPEKLVALEHCSATGDAAHLDWRAAHLAAAQRTSVAECDHQHVEVWDLVAPRLDRTHLGCMDRNINQPSQQFARTYWVSRPSLPGRLKLRSDKRYG